MKISKTKVIKETKRIKTKDRKKAKAMSKTKARKKAMVRSKTKMDKEIRKSKGKNLEANKTKSLGSPTNRVNLDQVELIKKKWSLLA